MPTLSCTLTTITLLYTCVTRLAETTQVSHSAPFVDEKTRILHYEDDLSRLDFSRKYTRHPMLFYDNKDVTKYRRAGQTTHSHILKDITELKNLAFKYHSKFMPPLKQEEYGAHWNELFGNNLAPLAFYCVLFPTDSKVFQFVETYMDRMASYSRWQVSSSPTDEVPLGHALAGFATAFDMLYNRFSSEKRKLYLQKIINVTEDMYKFSFIRWWGRTYLQNHVATNVVSILIGALVTEAHHKEASVWKRHATLLYERTVAILNLIKDGSLNEGVGYTGYTSRSLTMYIYLVKRHLKYDHTHNPWFKEHFNFFYHTVLHDFQTIVGIADSGITWWYGPESQLVFLDAFVLRNGNGNWLAMKARQARTKRPVVIRAASQKYSTLHTEFMWYDPSLTPVPPKGHGAEELHLFRDWGVVTFHTKYRTGFNRTFFSFKASKLHGNAVNELAHRRADQRPSWIQGWVNFNPGHEHPDQNSFVFAPNGKVLVSECFYGPKFSDLNNVLMFKPSLESPCTTPWSGQLGDCAKWLRWHTPEQQQSNAKIIAAGVKDGVMFVSGESAGAYHPSLGLKSVYRSAILLTPQLLLVADFVALSESSPLTTAKASFNNIFHTFEADNAVPGLTGAKTKIDGAYYKSYWTVAPSQTMRGFIETVSYKHIANKIIKSSHLNITFSLRGGRSAAAFVFHGPTVQLRSFVITKLSASTLSISLDTSQGRYVVVVSTHYNLSNGKLCVVRTERGKITYGPQFKLESQSTDQDRRVKTKVTELPVGRLKPIAPERVLVNQYFNTNYSEYRHTHDGQLESDTYTIEFYLSFTGALIAIGFLFGLLENFRMFRNVRLWLRDQIWY